MRETGYGRRAVWVKDEVYGRWRSELFVGGRAQLSSVAQRARISLLRVKRASEGNDVDELAGATAGRASISSSGCA